MRHGDVHLDEWTPVNEAQQRNQSYSKKFSMR